eukprot:12619643-Heterocapsa_arctica.AAC.1
MTPRVAEHRGISAAPRVAVHCAPRGEVVSARLTPRVAMHDAPVLYTWRPERRSAVGVCTAPRVAVHCARGG